MSAAPHPTTTTKEKGINILVVNPNSTEAFTESMRTNLVPLFPPTLNPPISLSFLTSPPASPPSINSIHTSISSTHHTLPLILSHLSSSSSSAATPPTSAVVIACFSAHPLVEVLRELVDVPVVGIMQSSILVGSQLGGSVGVVTTDARWEPLLTREIRAAGMDRLCSAGVVSSRLRVLDLERLPRTEVVSRLCAEARRLVVERGADVVVLGCAGMVGLTEAIERDVGGGVCVVDPVRAGVEVAVGLARLGLATARSGVYQ